MMVVLLVPLFLLSDPFYARAFDPAQLQAWSHLAIELHGHGFGVGLVFFGFVLFVEGHLVRKSGFLPGPTIRAEASRRVTSVILASPPPLAYLAYIFTVARAGACDPAIP